MAVGLIGAQSALAVTAIGSASTDEFAVNVHTTNMQRSLHSAMHADGHFVAVWDSTGQDGSGLGVYARIFDADGSPRTPEFSVNESTLGHQSVRGVRMDNDGNFVVAWQSSDDGSESGVYVRRYDAEGVATTPEQRANDHTNGHQVPAAFAMNADGEFVVTWFSTGQDGSGTGVYARRYEATGLPAGSEFQVSQYTSGDQNPTHVEINDDGDFVVVWSSFGQDGSSYGIYARPYQADGLPASAEVAINSFTTDMQWPRAVALAPDGDFVVAWGSYQQDGSYDAAYARVFSAAGVPRTGELALCATTENGQTPLAIAMDSGGRFVIVGTDGGAGSNLFAQLYDADGATLSGEIRVNLTPVGSLVPIPQVAFGGSGGFMVAWSGSDGDGDGVKARVFLADGAPATGELAVSDYTTGHQSFESLAADARGNFVIAWRSMAQDGSDDGVFARAYAAEGTPASGEIPVSGYTSGRQFSPRVMADADGDFVVTWISLLQDGSQEGLYARRFAGFEDVDLALSIGDSADPVEPHDPFTYTLTATNTHASAADSAVGIADGIRIIDTLPAGMAYRGFTGAGWDCGEDAGTIRCEYRQPLAAGAHTSVALNVTAPAVVAALSNAATISGQQIDGDATDDFADEGTAMTCTPGTVQFRLARFTTSEVAGIRKITVDRVGGDCGAVSVQYVAAAGTATAGTDFVATSGTLSWPDNDATERKFNLQVLGDTIDEEAELVNLTLSNPSGGASAGAASTLKIQDDDDAPEVSISGAAIANEGQIDVLFTLSLDRPTYRDTTVVLMLGGTATRDADYQFRNPRNIIPAGQTTLTRNLRSNARDIFNDSLDDDDETITLTITRGGGATISATASSHTITIVDDD